MTVWFKIFSYDPKIIKQNICLGSAVLKKDHQCNWRQELLLSIDNMDVKLEKAENLPILEYWKYVIALNFCLSEREGGVRHEFVTVLREHWFHDMKKKERNWDGCSQVRSPLPDVKGSFWQLLAWDWKLMMNLHAWNIGTASELMNQLLTRSLTEYNGKCLKLGKAARCLVYLLNRNRIFQSEGKKWLSQMLILIW